LFAKNLDSGVRLTTGVAGLAHCELVHSTIAGNTSFGVILAGDSSALVRNSVLASNADDFSGSSFTADSSDSADGALLGQPGCIAADPLFVDALGGDFRLRPTSPCVDTANSAFTTALDLVRHTRPVDGDLDTLARPDMGAIEFEQLVPVGAAHLGGVILVELWGPASAVTTVYAARYPLASVPFATQYGDFWLERRGTATLTRTLAGSSAPTLVPCRLPSHPSAIGTRVTLQALISSALAPAGAAFSNPVELTIVP
jgi:hypothetical protein